jgi:hypothetical protein
MKRLLRPVFVGVGRSLVALLLLLEYLVVK